MHVNCRSILGKLNEITNLLEQLSVDILAVSETWLDEPSVDLIHIRGYNFVHRSRTTGRGGGVGLFVKDQLDYQSVELIDNSMHHHSYESLFLRFPQSNGSYFLSGVVYRPPGKDLEEFNTEFGQLLDALTSKNKDMFILGDFNIDLLNAHLHAHTNYFSDMMSSHHLLPAISQPTRVTATSSTLIDNIYSNRPFKIIKSVILVADLSDHLPLVTWVMLILELATLYLHLVLPVY